MEQSRSVTMFRLRSGVSMPERRKRRTGPSFASSRLYQRHVEQELRFHVVRGSDAVPGSKTWREKRARSGDRAPFRTEAEIVRAVIDRAAESGNPEIFNEATDCAWDMVLAFTRIVRRIITDGRARLGGQDDLRAA